MLVDFTTIDEAATRDGLRFVESRDQRLVWRGRSLIYRIEVTVYLDEGTATVTTSTPLGADTKVDFPDTEALVRWLRDPFPPI